ncbi:MAG TPA: class I SAM-dependent methyltransferase [Desulfomonilaceae bacterium]|nr:class I SAM-dependent methyltransferase [Desulfomonilaceae bacterium]
MKNEIDYSFTRYLSAKRTVDDRGLNKSVWQSLVRAVSEHGPGRLNVLEMGAGIGTMVERALDWGLIHQADYTAIDSVPENIIEAEARLRRWGKKNGYSLSDEGMRSLRLTNSDHDVLVNLETADVLEFMKRDASRRRWDLLIANAFLDLVDVPATLPDVLAMLKPGGLFYFTINFDGSTIFQPDIDPELDARIEALYHATMDSRITDGKLSGDSRTGRHFFQHARSAGVAVLEAGSSDWVVFPGAGGYPEDEAYFLHFIVHTMGLALSELHELDPDHFAAWIRERHAQIDSRQLVYIAHQMDFLGRV